MEKIYYSDIDTPIGKIWSAISKKGLLRLNLPCAEQKFLDELGKQIDSEPEYRPTKLDGLSLWLDDYFVGKTRLYKKPFDLRGTSFQKKVWMEIYKIPYGELTSYGLIAEVIKKPKASRAVGNAVGQNPVAIVIPCHRVVWSNGGIGGFGGGLERKRFLLNVESVLPSAEGKPEKGLDLTKFFYNQKSQ
ncbi:MAG: methylated-DNA--[protein]-cysteine S-methyltransferase [Candidatus Bathyarchaeota archaeon]|nr:methylated-DNA--[protein]-cysteine S-methyltransferase [Candidatus Bathyarchaeota archaeon]